MNRSKSVLLPSLVLSLFLASLGRCADPAPRCPETPCEGHARAGCPQLISWFARPADTPNYLGYYVGGGAAVHGQPPCPDEGTWGWDYGGVIPKRVILQWWHGAHAQGGGGSYATSHK
jgi:hypothetical protein